MLATALPSLLDIARDRSSRGRRRLAEALADAYMQPGQMLSQTDSAHLSDFLSDLLAEDSTSDIRRFLAERAAFTTALPPELARQLAMDEISIAKPILKNCPMLAEEDLLSVIGLKSLPHNLAIAERQALSEAVADALVITGNVEVVEAVLRNAGAKLTRRGMDKCVDLAKQIQSVRPLLVERSEFTAEDASQMMWYLPRELRLAISQRFGAVGGTANTNNIQATVDDMMMRFAASAPTEREADVAATWLYDRKAITGQVLSQVLRMRSGVMFTALMAKMLHLPTALVQKCFVEKTGQLLAVLCRASGMDKSTYASTYMLAYANAYPAKPLESQQLSGALEAYDRVAMPRALTMVRAWQADPELLKSRV